MSETWLEPIPATDGSNASNDWQTLLAEGCASGILRQLDVAFAKFIASLDRTATPTLMVSAALLAHLEGRGHSCLPLAALCHSPKDLLAWPAPAQAWTERLHNHLPATLPGWLAALRISPVIQYIGHSRNLGQPLILDGPPEAPRLYLRRYWYYERLVTQAIIDRTSANVAVDTQEMRVWINRLFGNAATGQHGPVPPVDWQKVACAIAARGYLTLITGGPGTGKTYTAARLLALLLATSAQPEALRIALAAPTGKAATRLKQSIDDSLLELQTHLGNHLDLTRLTRNLGGASTLHALLGARPDTRHFRFHAGNPLPVDVVIVDEASMIHLEMMASLLAALPPRARLILLGDKDQLASVEAGAVLGDLCRDAHAGHYDADTASYLQITTDMTLPESLRHPQPEAPRLAQHTVMLRESRRFHGAIGELAKAVNEGLDPELPGRLLRQDTSGVLWGAEGAPLTALLDMACRGRHGVTVSYRDYLTLLDRGAADHSQEAHDEWVKAILRAFDRCRVLCAVREGDWGVAGINRAIITTLAREGLLAPRGTYYAGRPVMVTRNDPTLGVFNGDIGMTLPAREEGSGLRVYFLQGDGLRSVSVSRLAQVETAFAMTVHKSQGSEFEHTILALAAHSGTVLTRELLYTGITRARKAFSLIAEREGLLAAGVARITKRESGLWL